MRAARRVAAPSHLSRIGLIVALLALALWATPSAAVVHGHGPDVHATTTQVGPDHPTHACGTHGETAQAACCGLACCPSLALLPAPILMTSLRPAPPTPDRSARGASLIPDVLPPPPKRWA
jgi:hypothetical protein